jgi:hypothetical protein
MDGCVQDGWMDGWMDYRSNVNVQQQLVLCEAWKGLGALAEELHSFTD